MSVVVGCHSLPPIVLEAEQGTLTDLKIVTEKPGYTGAGYVTGFKNQSGLLAFDFDAPRDGVYDLKIRYLANGAKGYFLTVNDVGADGMLPSARDAFDETNAGKVELKQGKNHLTLGRGWGYYEIDSITLTPSTPFAMPKPIAPMLVNPNATPAALAVMKTLTSQYGKVTLSGVIRNEERAYVHDTTGKTPAIIAGDLIEYSPSRREHHSDPHNETERIIDASRAGHLVTLCWHWNAPKDLIDQRNFTKRNGQRVDASWYRGFYSEATTFDFAKALDDPNGADYAILLRDIDAIAVELKKAAEADVPILWRPLHESDGTHFWWGTQGSDNFKRLWRVLYDRLTNHHHLNNLIWVYTWSDPAWYPGDDVVDIVGVDMYPSNINDRLALKYGEAMSHFDGKKLLALSEFGGTPDVPNMFRLGVRWSYFASWTGAEGPRKNNKVELKRMYTSPVVGTLGK